MSSLFLQSVDEIMNMLNNTNNGLPSLNHTRKEYKSKLYGYFLKILKFTKVLIEYAGLDFFQKTILHERKPESLQSKDLKKLHPTLIWVINIIRDYDIYKLLMLKPLKLAHFNYIIPQLAASFDAFRF